MKGIQTKRIFIVALTACVLLSMVGPKTVRAATEAEKRLAIDAGIEYLANQQQADGRWLYGGVGSANYDCAVTGIVLKAFLLEGYAVGEDVVIDGTNYGDVVGAGLNYVFNQATQINISTQPAGNPDANGNSIGVFFGPVNYSIYNTSMSLLGLVATNTPSAVVTTGSQQGRTYADVIQDAIDYLAYGQNESGPYRGGWRFSHNYSSSGQENSPWPCFSMLDAEQQMGLIVPLFVKSELTYWLNYIQYYNGSGTGIDGSSGFTNPTQMNSESKTGGLLGQMIFAGTDYTGTGGPYDLNHVRLLAALGYLNRQWPLTAYNTWYGNFGHPYAMCQVYRGLELTVGLNDTTYITNLRGPGTMDPGDTATWSEDYCEYLVTDQLANGSWPDHSNSFYAGPLTAAWYIEILNGNIEQQPTITVEDPNGDELMLAGGNYTITWQSQGNISEVLIEYSTDNGSNWTGVSPANSGNTGSYSWSVPAVTSDQCLVRITSTANSSVNDQSDAAFRITQFGPGTVAYVDADAVGNNNGTSWADAFNHLQDALSWVQYGSEIRVAEGTYRPDENTNNPSGTDDRGSSFALVNGVPIYGGYAGYGEADPDERDFELYETVLSGDIGTTGNNNDNSYHVVAGAFLDPNSGLDGLTITAGHGEGGYPDYVGGGIYLDGTCNLVINNCVIKENVSGAGGGLAAWCDGSPFISNCVFLDNTSTGAGGGLDLQHSGPVLRSCLILGNSAITGGGLRCINNYVTPIMTNCVLSGNSAANEGGGLHNVGTGGNPNGYPPELVNCTISRNSAITTGGGIYNEDGNDVALNSCIAWGNDDSGGTDESAQITSSSASPEIDYSCVQGWTGVLGGTGNIGTNPLFIDDDGEDDTVGTIDDNLRLMENSPCINTGQPGVEYNDPDGSRNDMGAYGGPWSDQSEGYGEFSGSGFIFTTVGNIPTSLITQDPCDPCQIVGTANVSAEMADEFSIPAYKNAPFGSKIWIHGLFGSDDDVDYYQILLGAWDGDTPPAAEDFEALDDKLTKVLYTYDPGEGEWTSENIKIGPLTVDSIDNLYMLTSASEGFWSHLDLRCIWDTRNYPDGKYTLTCKAYQDSGGSLTDVTGALADVDELILQVDNCMVTAIIHNVKYDPCSPSYDPLEDGEIQECGIVSLLEDDENLRFTITASHPNGYLRKYILDNIAGKNDNRGIIAQEVYAPTPTPLWYGPLETEVQSEDAPGSLEPWIRCAYQFRLRVYARTTNGYYYLYWTEFNDHYFLDLGTTPVGCKKADIHEDNVIDILDFAELAQCWLADCSAP